MGGEASSSVRRGRDGAAAERDLLDGADRGRGRRGERPPRRQRMAAQGHRAAERQRQTARRSGGAGASEAAVGGE